ncbi:MAG: RNA methyltransferase [Alphaproteobacteria bacterium]|nr:RNA methyltransferase [Alphaproteobacteria bacterium]MBV8548534.1 RNA methyltransferase [Alphaproteobacteria bacterium]
MSCPVIILVEPQLVENIGMTARAMMNCALTELRIVNPRDPWPLGDVHHQRMMAASSGADDILQNAKLYATLPEALADLNYIYATAARTHDMTNRILTPRTALPEMAERIQGGQKVGVMFGRERTGLYNDEIAFANAKITIPLNPAFSSLNLAQAVLLVGYEWYQTQNNTPGSQLHMGHTRPATHEEYLYFYGRLEKALDERGFFVAEDMRPTMTRSLQNMLQRAEMTEQEVRTWHGVLSALIGQRRAPDAGENGDR